MNNCKDIKIIKTSPTDWYKLARIKICENQCNLWEGNNKIFCSNADKMQEMPFVSTDK